MAGNLRGKVDCLFQDVTYWKAAQEYFVSLYDFLNSIAAAGTGPCELIASYFGTGGTGMQYHNDSFPCGPNAWAVFRFKKSGETGTSTTRAHSKYVLIQWAQGTDGGLEGIGAGGGAPAAWTGYNFMWSSRAGVYIQTAIGIDSMDADRSPWGGTTLADGTDTKSDPVWSDGGAGEHAFVFPRENNPGGAWTGSRHALFPLMWDPAADPGGVRAHFFSDDDHLVIVTDPDLSNNYNVFIDGPYVPIDGLTVLAPHVQLGASAYQGGPRAYLYRSTVFGSAGEWFNGGILGADPHAVGVRFAERDFLQTFYTTQHQPNRQWSPARIVGMPIPVGMREDVHYGYCGDIRTPVLREVMSCITYDQPADQSRVVFGWNADPAAVKYVLPADGAYVFGSNLNRDGNYFSVTP